MGLDRPELREKIDAALIDFINQYELVKESSEPSALIAKVRFNCLKDMLQILALFDNQAVQEIFGEVENFHRLCGRQDMNELIAWRSLKQRFEKYGVKEGE